MRDRLPRTGVERPERCHISMKKKIEPGLQYLLELGLHPAKNQEGVYQQIEAQLGQQQAITMRMAVEASQSTAELYDRKNQQPAAAILFSGAYDADFYRQAFAWITRHPQCFGQQILEVGCDCGIVSCFLARLFPQAHITAIDRTENAIKAAKQLAGRLHVENVTFLQRDIAQLGEQQYDTVVSMRTIHENIADAEIQPAFALLLEQAILYGNAVAQYAAQIMQRVKAGGHFVTIEKGEKNPMLLGWLLDLHDNGLRLQRDTYTELCCHILSQPVFFQAISAVKAEAATDNVYAFWCSLFPIDWNAYQFQGWAAETVLQNTTPDFKKLEDGYYLYNQDGQRCGKYAVWSLRSRPDAVLYYCGSAQETTVGFYAASLLPAVKKQLAQLRGQAKAQGLTVQNMSGNIKIV